MNLRVAALTPASVVRIDVVSPVLNVLQRDDGLPQNNMGLNVSHGSIHLMSQANLFGDICRPEWNIADGVRVMLRFGPFTLDQGDFCTTIAF